MAFSSDKASSFLDGARSPRTQSAFIRPGLIGTMSIALTLSACGGSISPTGNGTVENTTAPVVASASQNADSPNVAGDTSSDTPPVTPLTPASDASDNTPPTSPTTPGFQVGTTTSDSALPPEPTLPATSQLCATLNADLTALPNGLLPDSADASNTAPDTTRIQNALTSCTNAASTGLATNKVVHLMAGPGGANAFLSGPLTLPSGVTLWIDGGVTLYASRDPRQFDKAKGTASCGVITSSDNGCNALITAAKTSNSAVMGDGTIDGRGGSPLLSSIPGDPALLKRPDGTAMSWWDIGWQANVVQNASQNNPRLIQINNGRNFTLYRITLQNAPKFHVVPSGIDGFTAWGVKIFTPTTAYEAMTNYLGAPYSTLNAKNTDGIDPASSGPITSNPGNPGKLTGDASNILIAYTSIRTGDDNIAIKGGTGTVNGRTYNVTIAHSHFYEGHGMSIGSESAGSDNGMANADVAALDGVYPSVSNVNVYDLVMDGADNGLRIKSDWSRSGLIANIHYQNVCIRTADPTAALKPQALIFSPYYSPTTNAGLYPNFRNISLDGIRIVNASGYTFQGFNTTNPILAGKGWSAGTAGLPNPPVVNPLQITLNNVVADVAPLSMTAADAQIGVGAGGTNLPLQGLGNGVALTQTASGAANPPVDCSLAFVPFPGSLGARAVR
ncbi:glycoside hydrolase [Paraburkholderia sp. Ac-20340]|uniref:glycoside hydrolase family 28 protein n=1 Tax=Paraburkholderia sp. Ac-20340 TaxID=2703888 RepID=UPI0019825E96|nr:glycosyl hydrolase family 28 protein [Paraburkholderia sp. Ac-20340]MBN3857464.1 glycoside hydrolase [Paraburkholderia sp. Ac-20340]